MNTEITNNHNEVPSIGILLRRGRERCGFSQQTVAKRLCLKVSIIKDLEEDKIPSDLASIFLYGYIRSYAKLVHIQEELLPTIDSQAIIGSSKISPIQNSSFRKQQKNNDNWLTVFTFLVILLLISLTGIWWWQNQKAQHEEIVIMSDRSKKKSSDTSIDLQSPTKESSNPVEITTQMKKPSIFTQTLQLSEKNTIASTTQENINTPMIGKPLTDSEIYDDIDYLTNYTKVKKSLTDPGALVIKFTADCWLEITDVTGKKLFSGLQNKNDNLNLIGHAPYKLKIGAPAAVRIQYSGQPIDLSRFVKKNHVTRLTIDSE